MKKFSEHLKRLRESRGLTRLELAERTGVTNAAIGYYETGKREPQASSLVALASALGASVDELLGYSVSRMDEYKRYKDWLESYGYNVEEKQGSVEVFYHDPDDEMPFNDLGRPARFQSKEEFCQAVRKALKRAEHNTEYNKICFVYAMLDDKQMFSELKLRR